jgi:hypothetical protein
MSQSPQPGQSTVNCVGVWPIVAQQWDLLASPLRPEAQDIRIYLDEIRGWIDEFGPPRVLLLGVTPELYRLPWPEGTDFLAVDQSQPMIDHVWPGPRQAARRADWLSLSLADGPRDIVLCDGGFPLVAHPEGQGQLVRVIARATSSRAMVILRLYSPPARREPLDAVFRDLLAGRISNMNVLKLRLWMAIQKDATDGVELATVWRALHEVAPDLRDLARRLGWSIPHTEVINAYRDVKTRYHCASAEQVADLFCHEPGGFALIRKHVPSYEVGELCPIIVLRKY